MKLYAVGDLHLANRQARELVSALPEHPEDWLVLVGDVGETLAHLEWALRTLLPKFGQLLWVPGNHDLWTLPTDTVQARGVARYEELVRLCRTLGVITPEDEYPVWTGDGGEQVVLAPLFLLYDYSFRPPGWSKEQALAAASRAGVVCADEALLHPDPYSCIEAWCWARVESTAARLAAIPDHQQTVLISHFPLRRDLAVLPAIPQFTPWCGTTLTEDWHRRFRAAAVVYGHLHIPTTCWRDSVRFEEVSFGYPHQWAARSVTRLPLRQVLPYPDRRGGGQASLRYS